MSADETQRPQRTRPSWFGCAIVAVLVVGLAALLLIPAIRSAREAALRNSASCRLMQLALALQNYHDVYERFPPAAIYDSQGRPLLSWRVLILPYIAEPELFKEFHLNEPWDSPHNRRLIDRIPTGYQPPCRDLGTRTVYLAPIGPGTIFADPAGIRMDQITDGTSKTILAVEADEDQSVPWTKPQDWTFDPNDPTRGLGTLRNGTCLVAFADGHVLGIGKDIDPEILRVLFTRAGGEKFDDVALQ